MTMQGIAAETSLEACKSLCTRYDKVIQRALKVVNRHANSLTTWHDNKLKNLTSCDIKV